MRICVLKIQKSGLAMINIIIFVYFVALKYTLNVKEKIYLHLTTIVLIIFSKLIITSIVIYFIRLLLVLQII